MSTKISQTLSLVGGNLARPTRFSALIAPPSEVTGAANSKVFDVLCKSVKIPDISMEPIDIVYKGHTIKIPSRVTQEQTIELTMYLDEHHNLRQLFSNWISGLDNRFYAISNIESVNIVKSKNIYGNLLIKTRDFNETSDEPMNYLIEGIYPIAVSGPEYGSASVGEVSEFTVTLAYYRFLSDDTDGNFDDIDTALDTMGESPSDILSGFGDLGQLNSLITGSSRAIDSIGSAFSAIGNIF